MTAGSTTVEAVKIKAAGNHELLSQLRAAIWQMRDPSACGELLGYVRQVLEAVEIPFDNCLVYAIKKVPKGGGLSVSFHTVLKNAQWRPSTCPRTNAHVTEVWRSGIPVTGGLMAQIAGEGVAPFGSVEGSVLDVPFSHGVLRLHRISFNAYSQHHVSTVGEVAEVVSGLFHRLDDLEELENRANHIREVQNLALVGQLAAGAAHEINNSLTAVLGYCELLLSDELEPSAREGVTIINKAARQVQVISRVLLNLARRQHSDKEPLQLRQLVEEMVQLIRRQLENENVGLQRKLQKDLPRINGHAGQLQQVVLNLIQNSRDAILDSAPSGTVTVASYRRGDFIILEVADDGPGIPPEIRGEIFEPFFTTKKASDGTGLGLSVCREIIADHQGRIYVESRTVGTCLVVELPIAEFQTS
jgi:signal transduction histidine kinase